jgi:hypothetical protein
MQILLFRPALRHNINDTFIEWGIRRLLTQCLRNKVTFTCLYFEGDGPITGDLPPHDLVVVCGTPWIWDQCTRSSKYRDLEYLLNNSKAPKLALGLGACFPQSMMLTTPEQLETHLPGFRSVWKNAAFITVRDEYALNVFTLAGLQARLLCCPAVFASYYYSKKASELRDTVCFYSPQHGLSSGILSTEFCEHFTELQIRYAREYNCRLVCITAKEHEFLVSRGVHGELAQSPQELADILNSAKTLLSGRVHSCIYSVPLKIPAALLPVDSRYLTYTNCGGTVIDATCERIAPKDLRPPSVWVSLQKYKWLRFLRQSLRECGLL